LSGNFELFGALAAGGLQFTGPVRLHFDEHLRELALEGALPMLLSWRIVELEATPGTINDPFRVLGVDPLLCPRPAGAHADQEIEIIFVDQGGAIDSFMGKESNFDWKVVTEVVELARDGEPIVVRVFDEKAASESMILVDTLGLRPPVTTEELSNALMMASPLTDKLLYYAIDDPLLGARQLEPVLVVNSPLSDFVVEHLFLRDPPLDPSTLLSVLGDQPTLSETSLTYALKNPSNVPSPDLADLFIHFSPLPARIVTEIQGGGYLEAADFDAVMASQAKEIK